MAKYLDETGLATLWGKIKAADAAVKSEAEAAIEAVVGAAPEALDTLKELADALDNDASFASTITNKITELTTALDGKVDKEDGKSLVSDTEIEKLAGLSSQETIDAAIADAKKAGTDAQEAIDAFIAITDDEIDTTCV